MEQPMMPDIYFNNQETDKKLLTAIVINELRTAIDNLKICLKTSEFITKTALKQVSVLP